MATAIRTLRSDDGMLLLGRLDGRLQNHALTDIFLARATLHGVAALCALAGVPIDVRALEAWIAGRSPPPRASEGLSDPISVAAIFHLALASDEDATDAISRATRNTLRAILDDRSEAETFGSEDLAHFGPLWRQVRVAADAPFPAKDLHAVSERIYALAELTAPAPAGSASVVTVDGRVLSVTPRGRDRNWLIATAVPRLLYRAGFTSRIIPSMVLLPKFLPPSPAELTESLASSIGDAASAGLRDLDAIQRADLSARTDLRVTKRSKAPLLARLQIAYPGLQPTAVARLLRVSPQGARKLLATLEDSASKDHRFRHR